MNYADTSFLVSLYLQDAHTPRAAALARTLNEPFIFTPLHRHETRNAVRLAVFRREITGAQCAAVLQDIEDDLAAGVLLSAPLVWDDVFAEAERLGKAHTPALGSRGMDILHVAASITLAIEDFLTFDARQGGLARKAGLRVQP